MCWFQERKQKQPPDRFSLSFRLLDGFDLILLWFWYGLDTMSKRCCHDDLMIFDVDLFDLIFWFFFGGGSGGLVSKKIEFRDNFVWSIVLSFELVDVILTWFWYCFDAIWMRFNIKTMVLTFNPLPKSWLKPDQKQNQTGNKSQQITVTNYFRIIL